jgi:oxygen-independent coproporphyrinogen-3 oxidase
MKVGAYVQVPFCQSKCTYCNFHTGVFSNELYEPYVDAIVREIVEYPRLLRQHGIPEIPDAVVDTVYVGGGTPSLFPLTSLRLILDAMRANLKCELQEVTLEADPETITPEKASSWRESGFDRISIGVQSFHDGELKAAGRMHRREDIFNATRFLRNAGFQNISADLIAGLPHQSDASWDDSVREMLALRPEHISIYMMEIDEGSRLGLEVLTGGTRYSASAIPSDDAMAQFYERACERLASAGYQHYEISNWALPGFESRHNLKYWRREPYFGFGAGAHSFNGSQRWANSHDPASFANFVGQGVFPVEQIEIVTHNQALEEELFLGLRQLAGINLAGIELKYGTSLSPRIDELRRQGMLEFDGAMLRLAPDRLTVSNEVFVNLLA